MSRGRSLTPETCAVCRGETFDDSHDGFTAVCMDCGFVVRPDGGPNSPDWIASAEDSDRREKRTWSSVCRVRNATEQRIATAFEDIETVASQLPLSIELREAASGTFCDAFLAQTTDGRERRCTVAASLRVASLAVCRPIPGGRLADSLDITDSGYRGALTAIQTDLDIPLAVPSPSDYLPFVSADLGLPEDQATAVEELLTECAGQPGLIGKDPRGIAAAAVYLSIEATTQAAVADSMAVSTETVRQRAGQIREVLQDV